MFRTRIGIRDAVTLAGLVTTLIWFSVFRDCVRRVPRPACADRETGSSGAIDASRSRGLSHRIGGARGPPAHWRPCDSRPTQDRGVARHEAVSYTHLTLPTILRV